MTSMEHGISKREYAVWNMGCAEYPVWNIEGRTKHSI